MVQLFLSEYEHVAPLYITNNSPDSNKNMKSHMLESYNIKMSALEVSDILTVDIFRINVTSMMDKNFTPMLEKCYGKNWQKHVQEIYDTLSNNFHESFDTREKEKTALDAKIYNLRLNEKELKNHLETLTSSLKENITTNSNYTAKKTALEKLQIDIKDESVKRDKLYKTKIRFDADRFHNTAQWVSPKAIVQGHTKLGHKNDFRKLSNEMFNPSEENKKMICSEFGAVTIAASIDQLNRIVALDLQAAGLITSEQEIFKNPIPKNERINKIHPGRLVYLLKKAGAVEVRNETVDQYVKRNDLISMETANIEKDLPNKILYLLKNSKSEQDFIDKANKNLSIYLEAYKIESEVIQQIKKDSEKQFKDFYKRKNETGIIPSIKKFCKGIAVSLHLRTKEKSTKKLSGEILTQVEKITQERAYKKLLNEKIYSSMVVPQKPTTSVGKLEEQRKGGKSGARKL